MDTQQIIKNYFSALQDKKPWEMFFSDNMIFTNNGTQSQGRATYVESTKRFFSMIQSIEILDLIVAGDKACAQTRYELQTPTGRTFSTDVAEIYRVANGKIDSMAIYFDTGPFKV